MVRINLRPWRDERRLKRQQNFYTSLAGMAVLGGVMLVAAGFFLDEETRKQQFRNDFLRQEMVRLDAKIEEIKELNSKRDRLLERLQAIQDLQGNRPVIVRVFDELVRVLPEQLYYTELSRNGETLHIKGLAQNNNDVSMLMRNLDRSPWFTNPNLSAVGQQGELKQFDLTVSLSKPTAEKEEGS